eukprot:jgi/Psemu1/291863/fgenesh1_pg.832_\
MSLPNNDDDDSLSGFHSVHSSEDGNIPPLDLYPSPPLTESTVLPPTQVSSSSALESNADSSSSTSKPGVVGVGVGVGVSALDSVAIADSNNANENKNDCEGSIDEPDLLTPTEGNNKDGNENENETVPELVDVDPSPTFTELTYLPPTQASSTLESNGSGSSTSNPGVGDPSPQPDLSALDGIDSAKSTATSTNENGNGNDWESSDDEDFDGPSSLLDFSSGFGNSLAIATANERDKRRKKVLVEGLVALVCRALGIQAAAPPDRILERESGSCPLVLPRSFVSANASAKTTWTNPHHAHFHWAWEKHNSSSKDAYSTCRIRVVVNEGLTVELSARAQSLQPEQQPTTTTTTSGSGVRSLKAGMDDDFEDMRSSWKIDSASLSCRTGLGCSEDGDPMISADEVLLEGSNIVLEGSLLLEVDDEDEDNNPSPPVLRLQSRSKLSLAVTPPPNVLSGSDEDKRATGLALRACVAYLDEIGSVPNLCLSLLMPNSTDRNDGDGNTSIPTLEQSGERSMTLGDALRYYIFYYCSSSNNSSNNNGGGSSGASDSTGGGDAAARARPGKKGLTVGDSVVAFGLLTVTGTSYLTPVGAAVSVAALAAKDGVAAAARKGQELRTSRQQQQQQEHHQAPIDRPLDPSAWTTRNATRKGSVPGESNHNNNNNNSVAESEAEAGYRFGDITRGIVGSIREKRQQSQRRMSSRQSSSNSGDDPNDNNYRGNNWFSENRARVAALGGQTAGALAGFVVAGPLGSIAGSVIGSEAGQRAVMEIEQEQREQEQARLAQEQRQQPQQLLQRVTGGGSRQPVAPPLTNNNNNNNTGIRGIMARGREVTGRRSDDGYRFGDFSRGLVAKVRGNNGLYSPQ